MQEWLEFSSISGRTPGRYWQPGPARGTAFPWRTRFQREFNEHRGCRAGCRDRLAPNNHARGISRVHLKSLMGGKFRGLGAVREYFLRFFRSQRVQRPGSHFQIGVFWKADGRGGRLLPFHLPKWGVMTGVGLSTKRSAANKGDAINRTKAGHGGRK